MRIFLYSWAPAHEYFLSHIFTSSRCLLKLRQAPAFILSPAASLYDSVSSLCCQVYGLRGHHQVIWEWSNLPVVEKFVPIAQHKGSQQVIQQGSYREDSGATWHITRANTHRGAAMQGQESDIGEDRMTCYTVTPALFCLELYGERYLNDLSVFLLP